MSIFSDNPVVKTLKNYFIEFIVFRFASEDTSWTNSRSMSEFMRNFNPEEKLNEYKAILEKEHRNLSNKDIKSLQQDVTCFIHDVEKKDPLFPIFRELLSFIRTYEKIEIQKPEKAKLINNKVFNSLTKISEDFCHEKEVEAPINVGKKEDEIIVTLKIFGEDGYALSKPISKFDSNVLSAVYTLFNNGNTIFSAKNVYEILTGGSRADMSSALLPEIEDSLDKLKSIIIKIDATAQAERQNYDIKSAILESYLLPLEKIQVTFKGRKQRETAYEVIRTPAIFKYSKYIKQFITIPISFLKLTKPTQDLICLRITVLKRVFSICSNSMKYDRLAIDTLLKDSGIEIHYQTQKQRYVKAIRQTLELLKEKNVIEDFTTITEKIKDQKGRPTLHGFKLVPIYTDKALKPCS